MWFSNQQQSVLSSFDASVWPLLFLPFVPFTIAALTWAYNLGFLVKKSWALNLWWTKCRWCSSWLGSLFFYFLFFLFSFILTIWVLMPVILHHYTAISEEVLMMLRWRHRPLGPSKKCSWEQELKQRRNYERSFFSPLFRFLCLSSSTSRSHLNNFFVAKLNKLMK